jgi:hypothetical protein
MPLSPNGLANEIMNAMKGLTDKNASGMMMVKLGQAITKYLTKNTMVMYSWSGIMPGTPPVPDPVVMYSTTQIVGSINLRPTNVPDPVTHGILLGKQITDGNKTFQIMPAPTWTVPPGGFLCAPPIILPPTPIKDAYQYWLAQSTVILTFYKAWIKPTPLMGSHTTFLAPPGVGAIMSMIS